jgi:ribose transport system permease protein
MIEVLSEEEERAAAPPRMAARATRGLRRGRAGLTRFSGLYVWALFIALYAAWVPHTFLTSTTAENIAGGQAVAGILAIGVVFALAAGAFDLSFANNFGLSSVVVASLMTNSHLAPVIAVLVTLGMGAFVGLVNGLFVVRVGVNSVIATLAMSSVLQAGIDRITDSGQFITPPSGFVHVASPQPLGIPIVTVYLLVVAAVAWYVLEHSPFGRQIYATGAGPDAARLAGVDTKRVTVIAFVACGTLASLAGIIVTARIDTASPTISTGYLLPVFAAVFLGTTQIKPGRFNVWGTLLGIYLLSTGITGLQLAGATSWVTDLFDGVALLVAVSLSAVGVRRRAGGLRRRLARR